MYAGSSGSTGSSQLMRSTNKWSGGGGGELKVCCAGTRGYKATASHSRWQPVFLASRQCAGVALAIMKWCLEVTVILVSCLAVLEVAMSHPQLHSVQGVPLSTAAVSSQQTGQNHGLTVSVGPQRNNEQWRGVPLPLTPDPAQHDLQQQGVFLSSGTASHATGPSGATLHSPSQTTVFGVGLPPVKHTVAAVPLDQSHGVPLPPQDVSGGHSSLSISVGVPLPPHRNLEDIGTTGFPTLMERVASLKPVKNVHEDRDVQHAMGLTSVQNHLQKSTKADHAVKVTGVVSAHKQV